MTGQPQHRDYPRPPIIEALCQIDFEPIAAWSIASPGLLWAAIKDEYPEQPDVQQQMQAQVAVQPGFQPALSLNAGGQRIIFKNKTGKKLIIAGANTLSVNSLDPYEGWKSLRRRFSAAIESYAQSVGELVVRQVTVKYINRIVLPDGAPLNTYFTVPTWSTGGDGSAQRSVLARSETVTGDGLELTALFATLQPPDGGLLLDIEVKNVAIPAQTSSRDLQGIADAVHAAENVEFERSIREDCRKLFR